MRGFRHVRLVYWDQKARALSVLTWVVQRDQKVGQNSCVTCTTCVERGKKTLFESKKKKNKGSIKIIKKRAS